MLLGIGLVILGIAGLILPVMPGWIFVIPGLVILSDYFPPIRRLVDYVKERFREAESAFAKSTGGKVDSKGEACITPEGTAGGSDTASTPDSEKIP